MSTKDTTRFLHQPAKHYAAGHWQQGRPLLDSDFNEAVRLAAEDRRRALVDVIGGFGSPDDGFSLGNPLNLEHPNSAPGPLRRPVSLGRQPVQLQGEQVSIHPVSIRPGSAFLGGMRFELERTEHFAFQRDFLQMTAADVRPSGLAFGELYYLHGWEQCVSAVEDRELTEQALGGPDTMVRVRRMRRVERFDAFTKQPASCDAAFYALVDRLAADNASFDWTSGELRSNGRLRLEFDGRADTDPCTPDPPAQYLGTENQALRIMLTAPDRFVWSVDNGAPLYRVKVTGLDGSSTTNIRVTMLTPPRDEEHRPHANQVIELLPFAALVDPEAPPAAAGDAHFNKIAAEIGAFTRVIGSFDPVSNSFLIDGGVTSSRGVNVLQELRDTVHVWNDQHPAKAQLPNEGGVRYFYMRAWHDAPASTDVELATAGRFSFPLLGRTGIRARFVRSGRRGDYWTAALRVDQRGRVVPYELLSPSGEPPHGPRHFYMPIALLSPPEISDCRPRLRPLRDTACETRTVGDGLKSLGDYKTITEALRSLPLGGGRVVVRPGVYREELELPSNVVLDGCGDDTILQSPDTQTQSALIRLAPGAQNVKVRNFRVHAVEQIALEADSGAERVELASLAIVAFTVAGVPGAETSTAPLVRLIAVHDSSFRALTLQPSRRQAFSLSNSDDPRISGLSVAGDPASAIAPDQPLVRFSNLERLRLADASLQAFGQVALSLSECRDTALARLELSTGAHGAGAPTRSALDIVMCTDLVLEDSRIVQEGSPTEHAAVVVFGAGVTLRRNVVRALPFCYDEPAPEDPDACQTSLAVAWGGVQVRGGSSRVEISRNQIQGGLGHGVTLGSVTWGTSIGNATRREGAGKVLSSIEHLGEIPRAWVHGDLSEGFVDGEQLFAFDEGSISDVLIAENRIEGMATNGISALTVLGLASVGSTSLFDVRGLRIERNVITGNLLQLPESSTVRSDVTPLSTAGPTVPQAIPVLPYAGITLGSASGGLTISGNQILGNGATGSQASTGSMPTCGIFVLNGDGIVISRNRVLDNGAPAHESLPLQLGLRAGIAVLLSGSDTATNSDDLAALLEVETDPLVEARTLNTGELAGDFALRILDNVVRHPEGRALHVISTGMLSIDGNFLCSLGYHGVAGNEVDDLAIGDVIFVQGLGGAWETLNAASIPSDSGDPLNFLFYTHPSSARGWLANVIPGSPRLYAGAGGGVLFHNNQVVYDWNVRVLPPDTDDVLSYFPVVIIGQDHVGAIGNQFAMRLQGVDQDQVGSGHQQIPEVFLAHALIGGLTTQVARNRFAEPVESARISLVTAAEILNITTLNTGTHPTLAYRWRHPVSYVPPGTEVIPPDQPPSFLFQRNPALFTRSDVNFQNLHNDMTSVIRTFFRLLNQRP